MTQRVWLDWRSPALPAAARWLLQRGIASDAERRLCDLEALLVVVPGRRASRLLLRELLEQCDEAAVHLVPPRLLTPAPMVDLLAPSDGPVASEVEMTLAWVRVLREAGADEIAPLLRARPDEGDLVAWHDLADAVAAVHQELAVHGVALEDIAERSRTLDQPGEAERWTTLAMLAGRFGEVLAASGLADPPTAHRKALTQDAGPPADTGIVLVGVVELNRLQRDVLAPRSAQITAMVHAPEDLADRFDDLGCLRPAAWADTHVEVPDDQIIVADRPEDQAQAVVRGIAALGDRYTAEEIVVGLGDEALGDAASRAGHWAGLSLRPAAGRPLERSGPFRLLATLVDLLRERRFAPLATLVRHPDVAERLRQREIDDADQPPLFTSDWPSQLDRYANDHLPPDANRLLQGRLDPRLEPLAALRQELVEPLDGPAAPLGDWATPALRVLGHVYGAQDANAESRAVEACLVMRETLAAFAGAAPDLQPVIDAASALEIMLAVAARAQKTVPEPIERGQIEMLGWLELHLDPAPALIVAGVNDGAVPQAVASDAFLPDSLRGTLGLACNAGRYARDAYLLETIRHARRTLRIISGRRTTEGDLLTPSRLLLACARPALPARVRRLCQEPGTRSWAMPLGATPPGPASGFVVPPLPELPLPVRSMSVTSFRAYLACPYRYALRYLLRLRSVTDRAVEMNALQFGILAHAALHEFGADETIRDSTDPAAIAAFLASRLDRLARETYGRRPQPAVALQVARLRQRLDAFAALQAARRRIGWRIEHVEIALPHEAHLDTGGSGGPDGPDGPPMRITGRIDRIDRHETTGAWAIIDYKTSEKGSSPEDTHHGSKKYQPGHWVDVQLPLYRHLATQVGLVERGASVTVGFVNLPSDAGGVQFRAASWTEAQVDEGVEAAREVVRRIRAGEFELNASFTGHDDFERICHAGVFASDDSGTEAEFETEPVS